MSAIPKLEKVEVPPLTAWSYSRYNDYKTCPRKFAYKHLLRIKEPPHPAMARGRDIHKEGEVYLTAPGNPKVPASYIHFHEEMEHLRDLSPTVEQQWAFTDQWEETDWFGKAAWCRVVLDVCVIYEDNTGVVIDHKTGKKYPTNEEQMQLFALATFMKFPDLQEVSTRLWYLDQPTDNEVEFEYKRGEVPSIKKTWEKNVTPMFKDRKFPPRANATCKWCMFSKAKGGPCKY